MKTPSFIGYLALAAACVVGGCESDKGTESTQPKIEYGAIDLTTEIGSKVVIDGKVFVEQTQKPTQTIGNIEVGKRNIVVTHVCFEPWSGTITVVKDIPTPVIAKLISNAGNVLITTSPPVVDITIDTVHYPNVRTPFTFFCLHKGEHVVRISQSRYVDWLDTILVIEDSTIAISDTLKLSIGSAKFQTTPGGATIALNGVPTGQASPAVIDSLAPGDYTATFTIPDFNTATQHFTVKPFETTLVVATLYHEAGDLQVSSNPAGVPITLDGATTGTVTPNSFSNLPTGPHTVRLSLAGYSTWDSVVTVVTNQTTAVNATLASIYGTIVVSTNPAGGDIWMNGSRTGRQTPDSIPRLLPGTYTVKVTLPYYQDTVQTVDVVANQSTILNIDLQLAPTILNVNSSPAGAPIFLNGAATGRVTPATFDTLVAGSYLVLCQYPNRYPAESLVVVTSNTTATVNLGFAMAPADRIMYSIGDTILTSGLDGLNPHVFATDFAFWVYSYVSYWGTLRWSPDGNYVAYASNTKGVTIRKSDGSLVAELDGSRSVDIAWSPDSRYVAYGTYRSGIQRYDVTTGELKTILATWCYCYDHSPAFSPDGSEVALVHSEFGRSAYLYRMSSDGTNLTGSYYNFGTGFDEDVDMHWISQNILIFKVSGTGIFTFDFSTYTDSTPVTLTQVLTDNVSIYRLSSDTQWCAFTNANGLNITQVGVWSATWLTNYPTYDISWTITNDALAYRTSDGVRWYDITQRKDYHIVGYPIVLDAGCVSILPNK